MDSLLEEINIPVSSPILWPLLYFSVKVVYYPKGVEWPESFQFYRRVKTTKHSI